MTVCITDDMMETENESLRERVAYLEKKVLEQGDEIVCLRSTLADVLRRLNQFDSRGGCGDYNRSNVPIRNGNVVSSKGK
jgi:microtubule-associated protein-like 1/2